MVKTNFKSVKDVERYMFSIASELKAGKISPSAANAAGRIANTWLKAYSIESTDRLQRRIEGLEALVKAKEKVKP